MAAYAALVSVMHIIHQIEHHPRPPISIPKQQVDSLTTIIDFLQEFLEGHNPHRSYTTEADPFETRIAEAAYEAEDVIEFYIVDQILAPSKNHYENMGPIEFYHQLQTVIEELDLIKKEVEEMKDKMGVQDQLHIMQSASGTRSFRSTTSAHNVAMVGLDDVMYQLLENITRGRLDLQVIPIVGMGGIGKTTLARNIYANPLVQQHFDVCLWSTISQNHNPQNILRQILDQIDKENKLDRGDLGEDELGEELYKYLIGRRYFIVMDDMWSIEAWNGVRIFFPDNGHGSRIVITTRLSNLASHFNYSKGLDMKFLDEATSWNLFSKTVFGEESCPLELKDIGKKIVEGCKGLPLSIVVMGGLLSKSERTLQKWELVKENLSSYVNLEDNESCLQILYMSYNDLPAYVKPCFLYMGVFHEDAKIKADFVIRLWIAEGFLKPFDGKSLEEISEEWLEELVDRNLLLVRKRNHLGNVKSIRIHDLLRDLCLREAQKLKFLCVLGAESIHGIPQLIDSQRRIQSTLSEKYPTRLLRSLESVSLVRTLIGDFPNTLSYNSRLMRVFISTAKFEEYESRENDGELSLVLVNLRFFVVRFGEEHPLPRFHSSISSLWNLQTLYLFDVYTDYVFEIWKMSQLRHVLTYDCTLCLPDPSGGDEEGQDEIVLENLQTLAVVRNLNFGERVLKMMPNIKKLKLEYDERGDYCLNNLHGFHKLESLRLRCYNLQKHAHMFQELTFPSSLKKLGLYRTMLPWEEIKIKIGWLPLLQVLKLQEKSFIGSEWETCDGQFSSLKFLLIDSCDLESWITDNTHFPRLEHLVLCSLWLKGIPLSIGDVPTLRSIKIDICSESLIDSARRILEEQEELGNEDLQLLLN